MQYQPATAIVVGENKKSPRGAHPVLPSLVSIVDKFFPATARDSQHESSLPPIAVPVPPNYQQHHKSSTIANRRILNTTRERRSVPPLPLLALESETKGALTNPATTMEQEEEERERKGTVSNNNNVNEFAVPRIAQSGPAALSVWPASCAANAKPALLTRLERVIESSFTATQCAMRNNPNLTRDDLCEMRITTLQDCTTELGKSFHVYKDVFEINQMLLGEVLDHVRHLRGRHARLEEKLQASSIMISELARKQKQFEQDFAQKLKTKDETIAKLEKIHVQDPQVIATQLSQLRKAVEELKKRNSTFQHREDELSGMLVTRSLALDEAESRMFEAHKQQQDLLKKIGELEEANQKLTCSLELSQIQVEKVAFELGQKIKAGELENNELRQTMGEEHLSHRQQIEKYKAAQMRLTQQLQHVQNKMNKVAAEEKANLLSQQHQDSNVFSDSLGGNNAAELGALLYKLDAESQFEWAELCRDKADNDLYEIEIPVASQAAVGDEGDDETQSATRVHVSEMSVKRRIALIVKRWREAKERLAEVQRKIDWGELVAPGAEELSATRQKKKRSFTFGSPSMLPEKASLWFQNLATLKTPVPSFLLGAGPGAVNGYLMSPVEVEVHMRHFFKELETHLQARPFSTFDDAMEAFLARHSDPAPQKRAAFAYSLLHSVEIVVANGTDTVAAPAAAATSVQQQARPAFANPTASEVAPFFATVFVAMLNGDAPPDAMVWITKTIASIRCHFEKLQGNFTYVPRQALRQNLPRRLPWATEEDAEKITSLAISIIPVDRDGLPVSELFCDKSSKLYLALGKYLLGSLCGYLLTLQQGVNAINTALRKSIMMASPSSVYAAHPEDGGVTFESSEGAVAPLAKRRSSSMFGPEGKCVAFSDVVDVFRKCDPKKPNDKIIQHLAQCLQWSADELRYDAVVNQKELAEAVMKRATDRYTPLPVVPYVKSAAQYRYPIQSIQPVVESGQAAESKLAPGVGAAASRPRVATFQRKGSRRVSKSLNSPK